MTLDFTLLRSAKHYLSPQQDLLIADIEIIFSRLKTIDKISDFSFIVAPAAKAYEGFLKEFFFRVGLIDKYTYQSDRFRVGKTLNPSLRYKRFSIFQKLAEIDPEGEELAENLWNAWKYGRNEIFHYFPNISQNITYAESLERIHLILKAIIASGKFLDKNIDSTVN
ncbi:MAG: hypothetical protein WCT01_03870 [Candidatus Shapirobacteria bacterium]